MRVVLQTVSMDGVVVIGEGEKDHAPMLFNGEQIGDGSRPRTDIAVDPIDGTTPTSLGRAVRCRSSPCPSGERCSTRVRASTWRSWPSARRRPESVDLRRSPTDNLEAIAKALGKSVRDVTVVILDRDRHADLIAEVRASGARIKLITDGDVAGAISTAWPDSGVDVLYGTGGTPEGVIAAAALKCMGVSSRVGCGHATTTSANWRSRPGTTSMPCSPPTTSCEATTASSPPPASPTESSCKACATRTSEPRRSRSS